MDPILEAAERKRDELRRELDKINVFLATYRTIAMEVRLDSMNITGTEVRSTENVAPVDKADAEAAREAEAADAPPPKRVRVTDNPKPADVVIAAAEVIRRVGRPLTRRQIHRALAERGIVVQGVDPVKALGTMLWRSGKGTLEQIEGRGYWVVGDPVPSVPDVAQLSLDDLEDDLASPAY